MKKISFLLMFLMLTVGAVWAQTTAFTYQGRLTDASVPASGSYDFEFAVFDANAAGTQQGATLTLTGINVAAGIFTVELDFGSAPFLAGGERFLEIRVKKSVDPNFTPLTPRQRIAGVPFGTRVLSAATADTATTAINADNLGGVSATNYLQTNGDGSGLTNLNAANLNGVVPVTSGGTGSATQNFVDLTTTQTVAGTKTFSSPVDTTAQYNIGGNRVLSNPGQDNIFAGVNAGNSNTGIFNSFFGSNSGRSNTTGNSNSFFGFNAGFSNSTGFSNSFFGNNAGSRNTTGGGNSFFGSSSGVNNTTGFSNSFFGSSVGGNNTTGANNAFFGVAAGNINTTGNFNVFIGFGAGRNNTTGSDNIFIGQLTGTPNTATQVTNSIGIGNNVSVSTSNTIVLGTSSQLTRIPGFFETTGGLRTVGVPFSAVIVENFVFRRLGLDIAPSSAHVCIRLVSFGGDGGNGLTSCITPFSSSENKTDIQSFTGGLDIVKRLKPVSFKWKTDGSGGIGLNAEDVAPIAPQIVTRNAQGVVQDVDENSLTVVLINAVKQQQNQIEAQQKQIEAQQRQVDALKKLVCESNPNASVCQKEQK